MGAWTKVLTHPLGLAGFALYLVFRILAYTKRRDERRWLARSFAAAAVLTLIAGLGLAYLQVPRAPSSSQQQTNQVQQSTSGPGSPAVQSVQGNVTVNVDQSAAKSDDPALAKNSKDKGK